MTEVTPDNLIMVARVSGAFGVRGELRVATFTADPLSLKDYGPLLRENGATGLTLTSARVAKGGLIVRAAEVETRDQAEALRGLRLFISRDQLPPPEDEDEFYLADLIGLAADTPEGERVGSVKSVHDFGAGDLLEIQPEAGPSWWLAFTKEAVPQVLIAERRIVIVRPTEIEETE